MTEPAVPRVDDRGKCAFTARVVLLPSSTAPASVQIVVQCSDPTADVLPVASVPFAVGGDGHALALPHDALNCRLFSFHDGVAPVVLLESIGAVCARARCASTCAFRVCVCISRVCACVCVCVCVCACVCVSRPPARAGTLGVAGRLWDCGVCLLQYLAAFPSLVSSRRVLELGAGTGVVGLAVGRLHATAVTITDLPPVCPLIDTNIALCGLGGTCASLALEWGAPLPHDAAWASDLDLVIAADVVYEPECFQPLVDTLTHLCTASSCKVCVPV